MIKEWKPEWELTPNRKEDELPSLEILKTEKAKTWNDWMIKKEGWFHHNGKKFLYCAINFIHG